MVLAALREAPSRLAAVAIWVGRVSLLALEYLVLAIAAVALMTLLSSWISG
jgi:hypothetical protein